jgi:hypothetical protein
MTNIYRVMAVTLGTLAQTWITGMVAYNEPTRQGVL